MGAHAREGAVAHLCAGGEEEGTPQGPQVPDGGPERGGRGCQISQPEEPVALRAVLHEVVCGADDRPPAHLVDAFQDRVGAAELAPRHDVDLLRVQGDLDVDGPVGVVAYGDPAQGGPAPVPPFAALGEVHFAQGDVHSRRECGGFGLGLARGEREGGRAGGGRGETSHELLAEVEEDVGSRHQGEATCGRW